MLKTGFAILTVALLLGVGYYVLQPGHAPIVELLIPFASLILLFGILNFVPYKKATPMLVRSLSVRWSSSLLVLLTMVPLVLAFAWPIVGIKLIDKNSDEGVLILALPSLILLLVSAFSVFQLILRTMGQWLTK